MLVYVSLFRIVKYNYFYNTYIYKGPDFVGRFRKDMANVERKQFLVFESQYRLKSILSATASGNLIKNHSKTIIN